MANRIVCIGLLLALLVALLSTPLHAPLPHTGNVLLLTAHPDDECMFFAPTLRALLRAETPVYSLCLSVGNADGLGTIRRDELARSLDVLDVPPHRRFVIDHPDLQDNFTARWDADTIASVLQPYVQSNNIETILTFDAGGISGHPNHCSLPDGVAHLPAPPKLYTLVTRPTYVKYLGVLAPLLAKFSLYQDRVQLYPAVSQPFHQLLRLATRTSRPKLVVVSGIYEYLTALQAMRAHVSQLVWFRWLYVSFSRYMWVNELVEISLSPVNLE
ncbi:hypothetical protein C0993_011325 [Termitomyces sp. T159_Od127]|nr:hypothetical protein C0993_011325 [Termitomyces sp. T159_Od127]